VAGYGLVFFMPLIVKGLGVPTTWIGIVTAVPFVFGLIGMLAWGAHSDRSGERFWHAAGALLVVAIGLSACILVGSDHPLLMMVTLCVAVMGNQSIAACFWPIPGSMLTGAAAAGGLAMVNCLGNLGGWFGPWAYGMIVDSTGSTNFALLCLALGPVVSAAVLILMRQNRRMEPVSQVS
jgi:MFS transporter, ACS family, tartrate transporter